jgi:telomerase protein component 1
LNRHGNKAEIWQGLIDRKKLPYMACVRNLRNLVLAGVDDDHIHAVCNYISNEKAVAGSRMFPFRFYTAFDVLDDLAKLSETNFDSEELQKRRKIKEQTMTPADIEKEKIKRAKIKRRQGQMNRGALQPLRRALEKAVAVATRQNIPPMKGRTLIVVAVGADNGFQFGGAKGLMSQGTTVREAAILFALMARVSSEENRMVTYGKNRRVEIGKLEADSLLAGVSEVNRMTSSMHVTESNVEALDDFLPQFLDDREWFDSLIWIPGTQEKLDAVEERRFNMNDWVAKYRHVVNKDLIFATVNLSASKGPKRNPVSLSKVHHPNDLLTSGLSETVFHCLATLLKGGSGGQVEAVESVDRRQGLAPPPRRPFTVTSSTELTEADEITATRWRRVRIFISSTFADMHGERDLINRFVMPELRKRCRHLRLDVQAVDLRWGVLKQGHGQGDEEADNFLSSLAGSGMDGGRSQVLACLREAEQADLFVGLLGGRHGWRPGLDVNSLEEDAELGSRSAKKLLDLLKTHLDSSSLAEVADMSMTELEIELAALNGNREPSHALFFLRDEDTLKTNLDRRVENIFFDDVHGGQDRLAQLKERVRCSGSEVCEYKANYGGIVGGKPVTSNLDDMGRHLIESLYHQLENMVEKNEDSDSQDDIVSHRERQDDFCANVLKHNYVARPKVTDAVIKAVNDSSEDGGSLVEVTGKQAAGTSTVLCKVYRSLVNQAKERKYTLVPYFVDALQIDEKNSLAFLRYLAAELEKIVGGGLEEMVDDRKSLTVRVASLLLSASDVVTNAGGKKTGRLIVVVDGLEELSSSTEDEWLPPSLPKGLTVVVSSRIGSVWQRYLHQRRENKHVVYRLPALDIPERKALMRHMLKDVGKQLDENAFNNEMAVVVGKRDAGNAGYLRLLATDIASFGLFDQLGQRLLVAGHTYVEVLNQMLERLEDEVGVDRVTDVATLLAVAKQSGNGLPENALRKALSCLAQCRANLDLAKMSPLQLAEALPDHNVEGAFPGVALTIAINSLEHFLEHTEQSPMAGVLLLRSGQWEEAVKGRYLQGSVGAKREMAAHKALAAAAASMLEDTDDPLMLDSLPYHLARLGLFKDIEKSVCRLSYVLACARNSMVGRIQHHLSGAFLPAKSAREKILASARSRDYAIFVRLRETALNEQPILTLQLALTEPAESSVASDAVKALKDRDGLWCPPMLLTYFNKPSADQRSLLSSRQTGSVVTRTVMERSPFLRPEELLVAHGYRDGSVSVGLAHSGEQLFSLVGHASPITALAFLPGGSSGKSLKNGGIIEGQISDSLSLFC